jgi:hypothetical protein
MPLYNICIETENWNYSAVRPFPASPFIERDSLRLYRKVSITSILAGLMVAFGREKAPWYQATIFADMTPPPATAVMPEVKCGQNPY